MSFMRLFAGLCDVSSPRQYILFIICWAAALLRLCCPARFYLSVGRLGAAGEPVTGPCGRLFQIVVVCSDSRLRLWAWSACTSGFNSSWASVFDEHICQDKLRIATLYGSYVFSATLYSATVTQVSSLGINVEQIRLSVSVLMEVLSVWADPSSSNQFPTAVLFVFLWGRSRCRPMDRCLKSTFSRVAPY